MTLRYSRWILLTVALAAGIFWLANARWGKRDNALQSLPQTVDFNWHIRPILSDRCFTCHGPDENKREANLRLDTREGAFAPLDTVAGVVRYAIVPGDVQNSQLVQRIFSAHVDSIMPPLDSHLSLNDREKQLLKRWIEQGAHWKDHWAFTPPVRASVPKVTFDGWTNHPIDGFVGQKLVENGLEPSPEADKLRLIRRVSLALTGLPPSGSITQSFENGTVPYEAAVDSLLASPAFGERWAMYWLDLARYADTHGYQDDLPRTMWPWRDWVIKAFNENMPYDQFVRWQLAGDLLPQKSKETLLASAFNRNHKISQEGGVIDEEYRVEYVADRTNTFGKAFLGLTLECARCHDHKYDPISANDYYSTFAFFNNVDEKGFVPNLKTPEPYMIITAADVAKELPFLNQRLGFASPTDTLRQMVMRDSVGLRKAYKLIRGQYDQHGEVVSPTLPERILPFDTATYPRNRLGMTQWLFDKKNPLTARVWVNRLWQELFGKGIVATSENFGVQGALPTHPELLDWLAVEFMESGWNMKHLLRLMVTSATYRQSAVADEKRMAADPENIWWSRGPRMRMPYEFIRDNVLISSGLMVFELGGPSVKPWQPAGLWEEISTEKTANAFRGEYSYIPDTLPVKKYRRSVYTYQRRTIPPPTHLTFDAPMRDNCEVRRTRSNTPLQALILLNDKQIQEAAMALSRGIIEEKDPKKRIETAFQRILTRKPDAGELKQLWAFYQSEATRFAGASAVRDPELEALMLTVTVIYNMDEAVVM
jgi:hypothetical protein